MPTATRVVERCGAHPSRPAVDRCPRCDRPRCAPDRDEFGSRGCPRCPAPPRPGPGPLQVVVRSGLAGYVPALVGGWVATQYVAVQYMSLILPAAVGLAVAAAASAGAGVPARGRARWLVGVPALVMTLLGVGLGFRLVPHGGFSPLESVDLVLGPYLAALGGVVAWSVLLTPPESRRGDRRERPA